MSEDEVAFADDATLRQWYCNAHKSAGMWASMGHRKGRKWHDNNVLCYTRYRVEMERRRVAVPNNFECYRDGRLCATGSVNPKE